MHEYFSNNTTIVPPSFGTNMKSQNEFHSQPNLLFARNLHLKGCNPKPKQKGGGTPPGPG